VHSTITQYTHDGNRRIFLNPRALNGREYELRNPCRRHPEASDIRQLEQRRRKILICGESINILHFY